MNETAPQAQTERDVSVPVLIVIAGSYRCALPLDHVAETMRPSRVVALAGSPPFVCGAAVIRGEPVPVVDLTRLLGGVSGEIHRFVVVRVQGPLPGTAETPSLQVRRRVALAVESVVGVGKLRRAHLKAVPGLLGNVQPESLQALSCSDQDLMLVLGDGRIVPDEVWEELASTQARAQ